MDNNPQYHPRWMTRVSQLERNLDQFTEFKSVLNETHSSSSSNRVSNATCFVFYLPSTADNATLRSLFMPYGVVLNAYVAMDRVTNRTRGFGFVDFASPNEAQRAVESLDKFYWDGKYLSVSIKV